LNVSFSNYFVPFHWYLISLILGGTSFLWSVVIQCLIYYSKYQRAKAEQTVEQHKFDMQCIHWTYGIEGIIWGLASIGVFFAYFSYDGTWKASENYHALSMVRNIFFIIQAVPF
jgi:hypothetical protein